MESLETFKEIFKSYDNNFDQAALDSAKSVLTKQDARAFETPNSLMGVLQNINTYDLPNDYVADQQQALANMSLSQAKSVMKKYMDSDKMIYLVVGDAETQLPRLKSLGMGNVTLLNKDGNRVK